MQRDREFVDRVVALLMPLGPVQARAMFGGWGLYLDGTMFALIAWQRLFIKVDRETRPRFEEAGSRPFSYQGRSGPVEISYWEAPKDGLGSTEALLPWAELGLTAARRTEARKKPQARRNGQQPRTKKPAG